MLFIYNMEAEREKAKQINNKYFVTKLYYHI